MLSLYPNITAVRLAEAGEATWSFFRWFWFVLWFALLAAAGWGLLRVTRGKLGDKQSG